MRRAALLHQDRGQPGVARAGLEQRREHARPESRVEVVDVGLQQHGRATGHVGGRGASGRACSKPPSPTQQPQHVGVALRVAAPGSHADARDRHRRLVTPVVGQRGQQRGAGGRAELEVDRTPELGTPRRSSTTAGGGTGRRPCSVATVPPPTDTFETTTPLERRGGPSRRTPRRRRRWRRAHRPRGSARPRRDAVHLALGLGEPREHVVGQGADVLVQPAPASSCSTSRQVRCGRGVLDLDVATRGREAGAVHLLLDLQPHLHRARPCRPPRPSRRAGRRRRPAHRAACRRWLPRRRRPRRSDGEVTGSVAPGGRCGPPGPRTRRRRSRCRC